MKPFVQMGWVENGQHYLQFTAKIETSHLDLEPSIRLCPAIFQECIPKQSELRVLYCVGDILTVQIDSQEGSNSITDWRADLFNSLRLRQCTLDPEIRIKIDALMNKLGLQFGCIDLIVCPNGEVYFLEVNEQGQFLWIEDRNPEIEVLDFTANYFAKSSSNADIGRVTKMDEFRSTEAYRQASLLYEAAKRDGKFSRACGYN